MLYTTEQVSDKIREGKPLLLAGDEQVLRTLPQGNWIAGTIPYFMDDEGGVCSREHVFVTELPDFISGFEIRTHNTETLPNLLDDAPENGFTMLILPAGSAVHQAYAHDASGYPGMFLKPVIGWIAGVHVTEIGTLSSKVVDGVTRSFSAEEAVAMHVSLPPEKMVEIDIVNVFKPGSSDSISFPKTGFEATTCQVGGREVNLAEYLKRTSADTKLPLTADYNGAVVNVSIQSADEATGVVKFYAPVFEGIPYKLAAPLADYVETFDEIVGNNGASPVFSCNCILNYLYSGLEGKKTGSITGPITFGEIAHILLNQTLVRLLILG